MTSLSIGNSLAYSNSLYLEVEMFLVMWTQQLGGLDLVNWWSGHGLDMIWQNEFGEYAKSTCQSCQPNQWCLHFLFVASLFFLVEKGI